MVQRKFDRIHDSNWSWSHSLYTAAVNKAIIIPLIMNDDAMGDPMSFNTHPEHASFAEQAEPNCYPDSEVRNFHAVLDIEVTKVHYLTRGVKSPVQIQYGLISCAFPEDLDAIDEKSGLSLKEIIELQKETTDRQCYPLSNTVDMKGPPSNYPTNVPLSGLLESVAWDAALIRDQQRYGRLKGLLRKVLPLGIRTTFINTLRSTHKRIRFDFIPSNAKFINPYTFLGLLINVPDATTVALHIPEDTQDFLYSEITIEDIGVNMFLKVKFNERNPDFHMAKV